MNICTATDPNIKTLPCGIAFRKDQGSLCTNSELAECSHRRDKEFVTQLLQVGQTELRHPHNKRVQYAVDYHTNTHGERMSFKDRHYLIPIYQDYSQDLVAMKAGQICFSDFEVVAAFEGAIERGEAALMIFPTEQDDRNRFVDERINPSLHRSAFYRQYLATDGLKELDKKDIKRLGRTNLYFWGSNQEFTSISVHRLIYDEYDSLNQEYLPSAESRQGFISFDARYSIKGGNPIRNDDDDSIYAEYLKTDQKVYQIRCPHCGHWQHHDFFQHVVRRVADDKYELLDREWTEQTTRDVNIYCGKCQQPTDRIIDGSHWWDTRNASWVPKRPSVKHKSGYHISKLYSPTTRMRDLWAKLQDAVYKESVMKTLHNYDLGLPYTMKGGGISETLLDELAKIQLYLMPEISVGDVIAGIDVQDQSLRVVAAEAMEGPVSLRAIYIGPMQWEEVGPFLVERLRCKAYVMDLRPEAKKARELQDTMRQKYHVQVWLCRYATHEMYDTMWKRDEVLKQIEADRVQTMDETFKWLSLKNLALPANYKDLPRGAARDADKFKYQMMKPQRCSVRRKNNKGAEVEVIDWQGKPDDYFQCCNYLRMCWEIQRPTGRGLWGKTVSYRKENKQKEERRIITPAFGGLFFPH